MFKDLSKSCAFQNINRARVEESNQVRTASGFVFEGRVINQCKNRRDQERPVICNEPRLVVTIRYRPSQVELAATHICSPKL